MSTPKIVDAYEIRIEEKGEFRYVHVHFQCADGSIESFEFVPPFAHKLSDELCIASARAARKEVPAEVSDTLHGS